MVEFLKAVLFGIVEGITEWLPISSTGHLILLNEFVKLDVSDEFYSMFEVVIQLGAILAVVVLFWHQIFPFGKPTGRRARHSVHGIRRYVKPEIFSLWGKILVACIPAVVIGLAFDDVFEALFYNYMTVAIMLILFGIAFIVVENVNKGREPKIRRASEIGFKTAFLIGLFQLIAAIFPGTSRSGATIVGALLLGVSRSAAAEFTFILAIPVMFGASFLKILQFGFSFTSMELMILLTGMVTAFIASMLIIRFLFNYIRKHDFKVFGYYRIALGIVVIVVFTFFLK